MEKAVYELVDTMKGNLTPKEKAVLAEGEGSSETDCYYALLNYFTQRNTEALVKCKEDNSCYLPPFYLSFSHFLFLSLLFNMSSRRPTWIKNH